jgi:hypothetical protein
MKSHKLQKLLGTDQVAAELIKEGYRKIRSEINKSGKSQILYPF